MPRASTYLVCLFVVSIEALSHLTEPINRKSIVRRFNPCRYSSSNSTPLQLGNGNFAFGADVTGLQTFLPYNTLSSWAWHNFSLPNTPGQTSPDDFTGMQWWTHGRLVDYAQPNPAEIDISNWLIQNPQRINLGRVGLWFGGRNVTEDQLFKKNQTLDLLSGKATSEFVYENTSVRVVTVVDAKSDTLVVEVTTQPHTSGYRLGIFLDFANSDVNKFDAPFVGSWNSYASHTTRLFRKNENTAFIRHDIDTTSYWTHVHWEGRASISAPSLGHRYVLEPLGPGGNSNRFQLTVTYSPSLDQSRLDTVTQVAQRTAQWWEDYWERGAFVDLTTTGDSLAVELQRRLVLSQYLLAVNSAGSDPPQESGLANNGWYGKFHLEMYLWHSAHWIRWNRRDMLDRSISVYSRFSSTSRQRASDQGYVGSRWGKMSDPTGRSAPGEINSLLIWQQPHPMFFAEQEYRQTPTPVTLRKWDAVLSESADFMSSFAFRNGSFHDLGPPMYPVSENTNPNVTRNPTFELAYWRFGLSVAIEWKKRQHLHIPESWTKVASELAPLPVADGIYPIYEGADMSATSARTDHPAMIGIYGLLPPTPGLNRTIVNATAQWIYSNWNLSASYGWDFPMLAANAARLGDINKALEFLLHEEFSFDDLGFPTGGTRVPTPYFPSSGGLLLVAAMLASGWTESPGQKFPASWQVKAEGFVEAL